MDRYSKSENVLWGEFQKQELLTDQQLKNFQQYYQLIEKWNEKAGLTAISGLEDTINFHFRDSLSVIKACSSDTLSSIVDVGTGGGIPGIPLKIMLPSSRVTLIEVNQKKVAFLEECIKVLGLENIEVYTQDWRTFLRNTDYPVTLVVARASLQPSELLRMFRTSSPYSDALLMYFASKHWKPEEKIVPYLQSDYAYSVGGKDRKLIIFSNPR